MVSAFNGSASIVTRHEAQIGAVMARVVAAEKHCVTDQHWAARHKAGQEAGRVGNAMLRDPETQQRIKARRREVMALLDAGSTQKDIAKLLGVSESVVKRDVARMRGKRRA